MVSNSPASLALPSPAAAATPPPGGCPRWGFLPDDAFLCGLSSAILQHRISLAAVQPLLFHCRTKVVHNISHTSPVILF